MKLTLDTNVYMAALISRGVCAELLEHCVLTHTIVASDFIFNELQRHLILKFKYSEQDANAAIKLLRTQTEIIKPQKFDFPVCRDPDDDLILGTAIAGQSICIITGDKDLLVLQQFDGIEIVNPSGFADFEIKVNMKNL